ncbi:hypothetical protein KIPB_005172, partial [Kipferlia bialata]
IGAATVGEASIEVAQATNASLSSLDITGIVTDPDASPTSYLVTLSPKDSCDGTIAGLTLSASIHDSDGTLVADLPLSEDQGAYTAETDTLASGDYTVRAVSEDVSFLGYIAVPVDSFEVPVFVWITTVSLLFVTSAVFITLYIVLYRRGRTPKPKRVKTPEVEAEETAASDLPRYTVNNMTRDDTSVYGDTPCSAVPIWVHTVQEGDKQALLQSVTINSKKERDAFLQHVARLQRLPSCFLPVCGVAEPGFLDAPSLQESLTSIGVDLSPYYPPTPLVAPQVERRTLKPPSSSTAVSNTPTAVDAHVTEQAVEAPPMPPPGTGTSSDRSSFIASVVDTFDCLPPPLTYTVAGVVFESLPNKGSGEYLPLSAFLRTRQAYGDTRLHLCYQIVDAVLSAHSLGLHVPVSASDVMVDTQTHSVSISSHMGVQTHFGKKHHRTDSDSLALMLDTLASTLETVSGVELAQVTKSLREYVAKGQEVLEADPEAAVSTLLQESLKEVRDLCSLLPMSAHLVSGNKGVEGESHVGEEEEEGSTLVPLGRLMDVSPKDKWGRVVQMLLGGGALDAMQGVRKHVTSCTLLSVPPRHRHVYTGVLGSKAVSFTDSIPDITRDVIRVLGSAHPLLNSRDPLSLSLSTPLEGEGEREGRDTVTPDRILAYIGTCSALGSTQLSEYSVPRSNGPCGEAVYLTTSFKAAYRSAKARAKSTSPKDEADADTPAKAKGAKMSKTECCPVVLCCELVLGLVGSLSDAGRGVETDTQYALIASGVPADDTARGVLLNELQEKGVMKSGFDVIV